LIILAPGQAEFQNVEIVKTKHAFIILAWHAEFLLEINLKVLLRKTGARLNFKISLYNSA
jgi:hypothetical protein